MARVKAAYKRAELVHRFIHTPDYMYDKDKGKYGISCYKNVLVKGYVGREGFVNWEASGDEKMAWIDAVALINREHKYIIISTEYDTNYREVYHAVPNDYKVFLSNRKLSDWHISSTGDLEEVLKLHTEYCVDEYYRINLRFFESLVSDNNRLDYNRANFTDSSICESTSSLINNNTITYLRQTYKIHKYSWYKEDYNSLYKQWSYKHSAYIKRAKLSADKVYRDKVFTASEKLKLYRRYKWTSNCYGEGISYNKYWEAEGKPFSVEALKKFNKEFATYDLSKYSNKTLLDALNDCLSIKSAKDTAIFYYNCELSKQNYKKALDEMKSRLNNKDLILNWMDGVNTKAPVIEVNYCGFAVKSYYNKTGKWENKTFRTYSYLDTVQLRLTRTKKECVETSKGAIVPLCDAISLYKLYMKLTKNEYPNEDTTIRLEDRNFKVGIYNLRGMYYKTKVTDEGRVLDYKEWCIVVGCHHIWMDDFRTFMNHFKLNNLFEC